MVCAATCAHFAANCKLIGVFGGPSLEADKDTHFGDSFLVLSTKKGIFQVQRLWHSSRAIMRKKSIELSHTAFAQSHRRLAHRFGPASGEIAHSSPNINTRETEPTTFMAFKNDADSSIPVHQIPSHCRSKNLFKVGIVACLHSPPGSSALLFWPKRTTAGCLARYGLLKATIYSLQPMAPRYLPLGPRATEHGPHVGLRPRRHPLSAHDYALCIRLRM